MSAVATRIVALLRPLRTYDDADAAEMAQRRLDLVHAHGQLNRTRV